MLLPEDEFFMNNLDESPPISPRCPKMFHEMMGIIFWLSESLQLLIYFPGNSFLELITTFST